MKVDEIVKEIGAKAQITCSARYHLNVNEVLKRLILKNIIYEINLRYIINYLK